MTKILSERKVAQKLVKGRPSLGLDRSRVSKLRYLER